MIIIINNEILLSSFFNISLDLTATAIHSGTGQTIRIQVHWVNRISGIWQKYFFLLFILRSCEIERIHIQALKFIGSR